MSIPAGWRIPAGGRYRDPRDSDTGPDWHTGVDLAPEGSPIRRRIRMPFSGDLRARGSWTSKKSYGAWVSCTAGRREGRCAHLSRILVPDGFYEAGHEIAVTGGVPGEPGAGASSGAHGHFEDLLDGNWRDPTPYLDDWFLGAALTEEDDVQLIRIAGGDGRVFVNLIGGLIHVTNWEVAARSIGKSIQDTKNSVINVAADDPRAKLPIITP